MTQHTPGDPEGTTDGFERTGDDAVDAVLDRLEQLDDPPGEAQLDQHVAVLSEVHDQLQRRLTAADG